MQVLEIDPPVPFVIPADRPIAVALVGCGGTGSHIAQALARLAAHVRDSGGPSVYLTFLDGDHVEPKNVGRQLFSPADVGRNKAQTLAARFSALFGLRIVAVPEMADAELLHNPAISSAYRIAVGAVDNAPGRRAIDETLGARRFELWLDCGNHEASGQVAVGSVTHRRGLEGSLALGSICSALPAPSLQYPDLVKDAPPRPRADCATAMVDNAQSLMVNQLMAAIAGQYLYQIAVARRLTTFATVADLTTLTMRSTPITATQIAAATGISPDALAGVKKARAS
jgi:PRTRC genetic system ThiF family protein